jgi:hypothetical protein
VASPADGDRPTTGRSRGSSSASRPVGPRQQAQAANLKRTFAILGIGCVSILVVVAGVMGQPTAAVGGCIGWVVVMLWSARNDRVGDRR